MSSATAAPTPGPAAPAPPVPGSTAGLASTLGEDLGWNLGVVFRAYATATGRLMADLPGGPRGYQLLTCAVQDGSANQGSLALRLGIDRTVLTYLIDDLEERGLVERRPDPVDRRSRLIAATEAGRRVWAEKSTQVRHVEEHVLAPLGDDLESFRRLLNRIARAADAEDPLENACDAAAHLDPPAVVTPTRRGRRR